MPTAERRIRFGPFDLNVGSGELRKGPTRLKVPLQSIEILKALLERPDELVTRDELRQRLWPSNTFVDFEHGLNAAVGRLREALGESADTPKFIETLPKRGYRFIGTLTVEAGAQPGEPLVQPAVVPISASPAPSDLERESAAAARAATHRGRLRAAKIVVPAALVFVVGGAVWVANQWARPGAERRPVDSVPVTSYEGIEVDPALSPDGNHVAFGWEGESGRDLDIYVKLVDGGPPVRVTTEPSEERAPAWSPDGRRIAFLRSLPRRAEGYEQAAIIVAPSLGGGPERRLTDVHAIPYRDPSLAFNWVSWMPDAQRLLFADQTSPVSAAIFTCQVESCDRRQLTHPGPGVQDSAPVASPDGKRIAFVRRDGGRVLTGRIFVLEVDGDRPIGEPRPVGDDDRVVNVTWTHDGRGLIYDAGGRLESGLWRIGVEGGTPEAILTNVRASRPSVDRQGKRLVFQVTTTDTNIWRMPGPGSDTLARAAGHIPLIKSTLLDASPRFSEDGRRLVFVSTRTGRPELWIARSDGAEQMQLTSFNGPFVGTPRWGPSGEEVAFDSTQAGGSNIYVVTVSDGRVRAITTDGSSNVRPSWSHDGRWIYYSSGRSGANQIWKAPSAGGDHVQVTKHGGFEAFESPDGTVLYYLQAQSIGVWQVPVGGGDEVKVIDRGMRGGLAITSRGLFIIDVAALSSPRTIDFFGFATRRLERVADLPVGPRPAPSSPALAVSPDEKWMLYVQYDQWGSDIQMMDIVW